MFGSKPFGSNTSNSFSSSFGAAPAFGQTSAFGSGTATTSNTFGTQSNMLFGGGVAGAQQSSTSTFQSPSSSNSLFSSNVGANVTFGKPTPFGATSSQQSAFQTSGSSLFANSASTSGGLFAQNTQNQTGSVTFGQSAAVVNPNPFGQSATNTGVGLFGSTSSVASGSNTFASSPFQRVLTQTTTGTISTKFKPVTGSESALRNNQTITVNTRNNCICSMKEYDNKSLEELRFEDYSMNVTGPQQQNTSMMGTSQVLGGLGSGATAQTSGMGLFRSNTGSVFDNKSLFSSSNTNAFGLNTTNNNNSTNNAFGSTTGTSLFSNQQKQLFSNQTQNKPFSITPFSSSTLGTGAATTPAPSFGMSAFNSSTPAVSNSLFSNSNQQQQQTNSFTQPNKPIGSFFQTSTSTPGQQQSLLGSGNTALQPQQPTTGGLFSFDHSSNAAGTQQQSLLGGTAGSTGGLVGNTSIFGSNVANNSLTQPKPSLFQTSTTALPSVSSAATGSSFLPAFSSNSTSLLPFNSSNTGSSFFSNQPSSSLFGSSSIGTGLTNTNPIQQQQQPMFGTGSGIGGLSSGVGLGGGVGGIGGVGGVGGVSGVGSFLGSSGLGVGSGSLGLTGNFAGGNNTISGLSSQFSTINPQIDMSKDLFLIKMKFGPFGTQGNSLNQKSEPKTTRSELMLNKILNERHQRLKSEWNKSNIRLLEYKRKMFFSYPTAYDDDIELHFDTDDSIFPRNSAEKYSKKYIHLKSDIENVDLETSLKRLIQNDENDVLLFESTKLNETENENVNLNEKQRKQSNKKSETKPSSSKSSSSSSSSSLSSSPSPSSSSSANTLPNQKRTDDILGAGNIIMNRSDYYTIPTLAEIRKAYQTHNDTCYVSNLTVGRYGYGSIYFPGTLDVANINFDKFIQIDVKKVTVYPNSEDKPAPGKGLNRTAFVTVERFWPLDKVTKEPLTNRSKIDNIDHVQYLMDLCKSMDANFIEYNYDTGSFVYQKMNF